MTAQIILIGIIGFGLSIIGIVVLILSLRWLREDVIADRLKEYVVDPTAEQARLRQRTITAPRELTGSLLVRLVMPAVHGFGRTLGRLTPARTIDSIARKLTVAGNPGNIGAREFYGLSLGISVVGVVLAIIIFQRSFELLNIALAIGVALIFIVFPQSWLSGKMRRRQNTIRKNLPDALDMLSVCATAGLGFDQAVMRVSQYWDTPLSAEFTRMLSEMEMGISRRDAMRNLADRNDVPEMSSFVALILQADQLGMSISETLQAIADQMRIERRFRAQEQAQKAPTKMLIPLAFLIFPALIAIILGPSIPALVEIFGNF